MSWLEGPGRHVLEPEVWLSDFGIVDGNFTKEILMLLGFVDYGSYEFA